MGQHTWFYSKIEVSKEEVYENVIAQWNKRIELANGIINRTLNVGVLEAYPKWTSEYGEKCKAIYERQLRMIKKGLCKQAVFNKYQHKEKLTLFIRDRGFFVNTEFHDCFRTNKRNPDDTYINDFISSREECFKWLEDNKEFVYHLDVDAINKFWDKYPDGCIDFG